MLRPISLFPFPKKPIEALTEKVRKILVVELCVGQMVEDVRLSVNGKIPVEMFGRPGGVIPTPREILEILRKL